MGTNISDDSVKCPQNSKMPQLEKNKGYNSNVESLGKVDTQASRPCAIIGPDRPVPSSSDGYDKSGSDDLWSCPDYRQVYDPIKMSDYPPSRNISPRQTFQENMQRIMVPPTYNSIKNSDESSFKNTKLNMPAEAKYCEVPFSSELKSVRNEVPVTNMNPVFMRSIPPSGWQSGVSARPIRPYPAPDFYPYQEFPSCAGPRPMPVNRTQRGIHEETAQTYSERLYQEANIRFKPYPNPKDRYPHTRYEYISNCPTTFHPPAPLPHHKFDIHKSMQNPYPMYPQVPLKYLDRRIPEPIVDGFQRTANPQANVSTFHNHLPPPYGPIPGTYYQNKSFPYHSESAKPIAYNKLPSYDPNNKMHLDRENPRNKVNAAPDNFYYGDRAQLFRGDVLPGYPIMGSMPQQPMYRKDFLLKNYEYGSHYRNIDQSIGINNTLSRLPLHFSPNSIAISPCDSNTSNETAPTLGTFQEDCGYVSQSSTTSMRSLDSSLANDIYKKQDYSSLDSLPCRSLKPELNSKTNVKSDKKGLSAKQFLEMWNEGDEEEPSRNKEVLSQNNSVTSSSKYNPGSNHDQLYVLDLVNVPSEELSKYNHLQKISKLPENIKGYNNIEILNQYEQLVESPTTNNFRVKSTPAREFQISAKKPNKEVPRPLSPLDVEAKISQSIIHKEVGCNFEIKPCSPRLLNVDIATPVNDIINERVIEKVTNPLLTDLINSNVNKLEKSVTIQPSCNLSKQFLLDGLKPDNYSIPDMETNTSVCLASLPQLDNDIELNFPEVNQQFINANKVESTFGSITSLNDLPHITPVAKDFYQNQNVLTQPVAPTRIEKESTKLSKYRKVRKNDLLSKESGPLSNNQSSLQQLRIDSVIIKNPDTVDNRNVCDKLPSIISGEINNVGEHNPDKPYDIPVSGNKSEPSKLIGDVCDEMAIDFSLNKNCTIISEEQFSLQNSNKISSMKFENQHNAYNFLNSSNESDCASSMISSKTNDSNYKCPEIFKDYVKTDPTVNYEHNPISNIVQVSNDPLCQEKSSRHNCNITESDRNEINNGVNLEAEISCTEKTHFVEQSKEVEHFEREFKKVKNHNQKLFNKTLENQYSNNCSQHDKITDQDFSKNINELQSRDDNLLHSKKDNNTLQESNLFITETQNFDFQQNSNTIDSLVYETSSKCSSVSEKNVLISTVNLNLKKECETEYKENSQEIGSDNDVNLLKTFNDSENGNEQNLLKTREVMNPEINLTLLSHGSEQCEQETFNLKHLYSCVENSLNENKETTKTIEKEENVITDNKHGKVSLTSREINFDITNVSCSYIENTEDGSNNTNEVNTQNSDEIHLNEVLEVKNVIQITNNDDIKSYCSFDHNSNASNGFECDNSNLNAINNNILNSPRDNSSVNNEQISTSVEIKHCETLQTEDIKLFEIVNEENHLSNTKVFKHMIDSNNIEHENKSEESIKIVLEEKNESDIKIESCDILHEFKVEQNTGSLLENINVENNVKVFKLGNNQKVEEETECKDLDKALKPSPSKNYHSKRYNSPWIQKLILYNGGECYKTTNKFDLVRHVTEIDDESNVDKNIKAFDNINQDNFLDNIIDTTFIQDQDNISVDNHCIRTENYHDQRDTSNCNLQKKKESDHSNIHHSHIRNVSNDPEDIEGRDIEICDIVTNTKCNAEEKDKFDLSLSLVDHNPKFQRRTLKRSLSESALEAFFENDNSDHTFSKRSKIISNDLCNILQANRRNSISEIYNENNVFILIEDNNYVLTDENETERLCYTEVVRIDNDTEINDDIVEMITENDTQENESNECSTVIQNIEENPLDETWVDDVACVETIYSDDIAEDIEISAQGSPNSCISSNFEEDSNSSPQQENVIEHMEKVIDIYGGNMCNNDAQLVETLFRTPQMNVDKTLVTIESHNNEKLDTDKDINYDVLKNVISVSNCPELPNIAQSSIGLYEENVSRIMVDEGENLKTPSNLLTEIDFECNNKLNTNSNFVRTIQHDDDNYPVHSWEDIIKNIELFDEIKDSPNIPSSPEVSSTTSEEKNSNILLRISNLNGSRISQIKEIDKVTNSNKLTFKLTERKHYKSFNSNYNTSGVMITKAAQKYIPPIKETLPDFKIKLPLPQHSLNKLKLLKISKVEPKIDKNLPRSSHVIAKPNVIKKEKPKFEDVLMNIDKFQYKRHKKKEGKIKSVIPKVVIKKNDSGSHYASSSNSSKKDTFNPDLTGRKWQPWVFLEKNNFIDKMAIRNKQKAIFCYRKNDYVLAEKFRKYKSIYNANFVISQPKLHDSTKGNLKYTIKLKNLY